MSDAPFAPWVLRGEAMVAFVRRRGYGTMLPDGIVAMPGPALVLAVRFTASPVGPYLRLAVAEPARRGGRLGWCLTTVVVNDQQAWRGERLNWGVPAQLGLLGWASSEDERSLVWDERRIEVCGRANGPSVPLVFPVRSLQERGDGPVVVPGRLRGRARNASIDVHTGPHDQLAWLAGRHRGFLLAGVQQVVRKARQPVGLTATLLAPARAPEAALLESGVRYGAHPDPGAYSSVG